MFSGEIVIQAPIAGVRPGPSGGLDTAPDVADRPAVVVLIPAHNEAAVITESITSLWRQDRRPDRVVVVADNCTDQTAELAISAGAEVISTVDNPHKKAGALNQALDLLMPALADHDTLLIMDADTTVAPEFIEVALRTLGEDPRAGGVSSIFLGRDSDTFLGELQRMEFHRYAREIRRNGNRVFVLSGTASVFRVDSLRTVRAARDGDTLPYGDGYYDVYSLTEDNEITLALRTLDYATPAPGVTSVTDVMDHPLALYRQRHRWYLGALRSLGRYGLKLPRHLRWIYWTQQLGLGMAALSLTLMIMMIAVGGVLHTGWQPEPIWILPTVVLLVERVVTVWSMGWKQRLIAALVLPEMAYAIFLTITFIVAARDFLQGRQGAWYAT